MADEDDKGEERGEEDDTLGIYVGPRDSEGERHGFGWAVLPNGDFYQGCYVHGMRCGQGLYVFMKNGARYNGEWRRHMKYGTGTFYYPDGSRYEGDWRYDLKNGFGAHYYPNGDIYEGAWFKGKRHGLGTYLYALTQAKFMGTWIDGVMEGPGQIMYPKVRYHGTWTKGIPKGNGCFVFDMNCMQHGFYLLVKDPSIEELGEGEEEKEEEHDELEEEYDETKGKVAVWRARSVTAYMAELLPSPAVPVPVHDSLPSIICDVDPDDLMKFEPPTPVMEEEEQSRNADDWLKHREEFIEKTEKT